MREYIVKVSGEDANKRLDLFLLGALGKQGEVCSRTFIQGLIKSGNIWLKNQSLPSAHYKVREGDEFGLAIQEKKTDVISAENIPLEVVYEDTDIAVINKPTGMVVHPAPGNYEHTLASALLHRFKKLSDINPLRPGIVHRLDKDTSGLLVVAKSNAAHLDLAKQFAEHSIKRKYIALVKGRVEFNEDVIELPIGRHPHKRKNMSVGFTDKSKYAKTYYRTLKRAQDYSVLELEPFTGRTHQLRVHLTFLGHPILGDTKYGKNNEFKRLALHAKYIGFMHPLTKKFMEFDSQLPDEFKELARGK